MNNMQKIPVEKKKQNMRWEYDVIYVRYLTYAYSFSENIKALKKEINKKCQQGWIPEGSFSVVKHKSDEYLCQTLIRPVLYSNTEGLNAT